VTFTLFILLMPLLNILRYDTATKELIVIGRVWSLGLKQGFYTDLSISGATHVAIHFFFKAVLPWLLALSIFSLLGYITGRFFCGWLCPEGALFEIADYITLRLLGRRSLYYRKPNDPETKTDSRFLYGIIAVFTAAVTPLLWGIALTGYFVNPETIWRQIINWDFSFGVKAGIIGVSIYIFISMIFLRYVLCKYVCAAGLMQTLFGWFSHHSLRIKRDMARMHQCTDCKGCEKVCFMDVKPMLIKRDINCVNCGECINACNKELGNGLFSFQWGRKERLLYEIIS